MKNKIAFLVITLICCQSAKAQFVMTGAINFFVSSDVTKYYELETSGIYTQVTQKGGGAFLHYYPKYNFAKVGPGKFSIGTNLGLKLFSFHPSAADLGTDLSVCLDYNLGFLSSKNSENKFGSFIGVGYSYHVSILPIKDEKVFIPKNRIPSQEIIGDFPLEVKGVAEYFDMTASQELRRELQNTEPNENLLQRLGPLIHGGFYYKSHGINLILQPSYNGSISYMAIGYSASMYSWYE